MARCSILPDRSVLSGGWIAVVWWLAAAPLLAQPAVEAPSSEELTISSDVMTVKGRENKAVFESGVVIRKGELTITADYVEVLLDSSSAPGGESGSIAPILSGESLEGGSVSQLRATGHVTFRQGDRRAESGEAIYNRSEEKITLLGAPVLYEKEYRITGNKMEFYLKENRSTVEGSQVFFQPAETEGP